jgi:hypothetical protein
MNVTRILVTVVVLCALVGGGYYFVQRTEVNIAVTQPQPVGKEASAPAPDYGKYSSAKHPKFPGTDGASGGDAGAK